MPQRVDVTLHALLLCVLIKQIIPPFPPPPLLISAFFRVQELLIYIFGHDASACCR